jgi:hypothetical protein
LAPRRVRESRRIAEVWICPRGRLDRSRRKPALSRRAAARLLRSRGKPCLCRPRQHRYQTDGAGAIVAPAAALSTSEMPLAVPPPRDSRFGSPLVLSRVHWVRPELVAEVKYLTWTADNLPPQVVHEGLLQDKPAAEVRREVPYPSRAVHNRLADESTKQERLGPRELIDGNPTNDSERFRQVARPFDDPRSCRVPPLPGNSREKSGEGITCCVS